MGIISGILGHAGAIEADKLNEQYGKLLTEGEIIEAGFKIIRDTMIFTNIRLILINIQGMTGKKQEYLSIPYKKITRFSIETAGHFDLEADLKIWVGSVEEPIEKQFNTQVDIYDVQRILARHLER